MEKLLLKSAKTKKKRSARGGEVGNENKVKRRSSRVKDKNQVQMTEAIDQKDRFEREQKVKEILKNIFQDEVGEKPTDFKSSWSKNNNDDDIDFSTFSVPSTPTVTVSTASTSITPASTPSTASLWTLNKKYKEFWEYKNSDNNYIWVPKGYKPEGDVPDIKFVDNLGVIKEVGEMFSGYNIAFDDTEKKYYYSNDSTSTTSWEPPVITPAAATATTGVSSADEEWEFQSVTDNNNHQFKLTSFDKEQIITPPEYTPVGNPPKLSAADSTVYEIVEIFPGWNIALSDDLYYYYNESTGESSYEPPTLVNIEVPFTLYDIVIINSASVSSWGSATDASNPKFDHYEKEEGGIYYYINIPKTSSPSNEDPPTFLMPGESLYKSVETIFPGFKLEKQISSTGKSITYVYSNGTHMFKEPPPLWQIDDDDDPDFTLYKKDIYYVKAPKGSVPSYDEPPKFMTTTTNPLYESVENLFPEYRLELDSTSNLYYYTNGVDESWEPPTIPLPPPGLPPATIEIKSYESSIIIVPSAGPPPAGSLFTTLSSALSSSVASFTSLFTGP